MLPAIQIEAHRSYPALSGLRPFNLHDRDPLELFARAAGWPSINSLFDERSLAFLAAQGVQLGLGRGGRMEPDGRLSFASISSLGERLINELLDSNQGFRWTDDTGSTWLVAPVDESPGESTRTAFAVSWYGQAWLFDRNARRRAIEQIEYRLASAHRPGRRWSAAARNRYAHFAHLVRRLRLIDLGATCLRSGPTSAPASNSRPPT